MLRNWRFDIINSTHWDFAWDLWVHGWVIADAKEWAFVLIIITFIPLWITGWASLSIINWEKLIINIFIYPLNIIKKGINTPFNTFAKVKNKRASYTRKGSYKEVRPRGTKIITPETVTIPSGNEDTPNKTFIHNIANKTPNVSQPAPARRVVTPTLSQASKPTSPNVFEHSLLQPSEDEKNNDFLFNLDIFDLDDNKKDKNKEKETKKEDKKEAKPARKIIDRSNDDIFDIEFDDDDFRTKNKNNKRDEDRSSKSKNSRNDRFDNVSSPRNKSNRNNDDDFISKNKRNSDFDDDFKPRNKRSNQDDSTDTRSKNKRNDINNNRDLSPKNKRNNVAEERAPQIRERQDNSRREPTGGVPDIMKEKGYRIFTSTIINNQIIDFIGVAKDKIILCLIDKEPNDWLADEENFNDEDPLWFSESSHRVSPVRNLKTAQKHLQRALEKQNIRTKIEAFLVIQVGNIINAEDMLPIWKDININVTRIDMGSPKDIIMFNDALKEVKQIPYSEFEEIRTIIRELK